MSETVVDAGKRRFLTLATSVVGGIGAAFWAIPYIASWRPSAKAKAAGAPVEADISALKDGEMMTVAWRGKPVWIVKRSKEMLDNLAQVPPEELRDPNSEEKQQPDYITGPTRSQRPEVLVMVGSCTHLGCSPLFRPETPAPDIDKNWKGGFFCPCHGSRFDLAGRVYKNVPAPTNLKVPPYRFEGETVVVIGEDPVKA
ncbi:MAG TPA: ubiquinol-cytochrome c reductase iron-sulfur subunit [Nevskiales bacterium]|nr:ubiquinol-cytochrome c reductase iron-sulfur subunit [Nevskiales bacterium]